MDINDKKLKRTTKVINFLISTVLAAFLIMLANVIIDDLDSAVSYPPFESFVDKEQEHKIEVAQDKIYKETSALITQKNNFSTMQDLALESKASEQESFDNWIKTRNSLQDPTQDVEVLKRVQKLDELQKVAQTWSAKSDSIESLIFALQLKTEELEKEASLDQEQYSIAHNKAVDSYDLKVFLLRLLFASPILIVGIYFFLKLRRHKFSPLFMGFSLFSVYVFFFGLVPYLPSYGGYIRYTVGIALTIGLGWYAIKRIRIYSETKKAELQVETSVRANKLQTEIIEKAFENHVCPSCGKDFLLKNWERVFDIDTQSLRPASLYCRHCGLQLLKKCSNCSQENFAHLSFCVSCGEKVKE